MLQTMFLTIHVFAVRVSSRVELTVLLDTIYSATMHVSCYTFDIMFLLTTNFCLPYQHATNNESIT